jgi:hypothetical protein
MFEEVLLDEEGVEKTCHDKILIGKSKYISYEKLMENIDMLADSVCDEDRLREILAEIVATYKNGSLKETKNKGLVNLKEHNVS